MSNLGDIEKARVALIFAVGALCRLAPVNEVKEAVEWLADREELWEELASEIEIEQDGFLELD